MNNGLSADEIVKAFFDFIVDGGNHGGLSGLEADLYNMPVMKQILNNQEIVERLKEKLDTMNKSGDVALIWVHDVFQEVLTGNPMTGNNTVHSKGFGDNN